MVFAAMSAKSAGAIAAAALLASSAAWTWACSVVGSLCDVLIASPAWRATSSRPQNASPGVAVAAFAATVVVVVTTTADVALPLDDLLHAAATRINVAASAPPRYVGVRGIGRTYQCRHSHLGQLT